MNWQAMTREELLNYAPAAAQSALEVALLAELENSRERSEIEYLECRIDDLESLIGGAEDEARQWEDVVDEIRKILKKDLTDAEKIEAIIQDALP